MPEDGIAISNTKGRDVTQTFDDAEEQAWQKVQQFLAMMPPYEFQKPVAGLLKAMGPYVEWIAPPGKDAKARTEVACGRARRRWKAVCKR
jgi:hypothetical protein